MNVVQLEKPPATLDIRQLDGRYHCLVRYKGHLVSAVLCSQCLSPSRNFIKLGDYYSDQLHGWHPVDEIAIVEVIKKIDLTTPPAKRPWWKRLLGIPA